MNKKKIAIIALVLLGVLAAAVAYLNNQNIAVLNPAGSIAAEERNLMIVTVLLGSLVGIPVFIMLFAIAWRYREGNKHAKYSPELSGNKWAESIWWLVPTAIIAVLSVITWQTSHSLDPKEAITSDVKPLTIQVIALDWKWLFVYPEQNVASVNFISVPTGTPLHFDVTADAPMNSFWIPQLGGQIYAMPGMATELNLIANTDGDYRGSSANISGEGFAGMHFTAHAGSMTAFRDWIDQAKQSESKLTEATYAQLAKPSQNNEAQQYSSVTPDLFHNVILKFMGPRS